MFQFLRLAALALSVGAIAHSLVAQSTPAPPDWNDHASSVYLGAGDKTNSQTDAGQQSNAQVVQTPSLVEAVPQREVAPPRRFDPAVVPSAHTEPVAAEDPSGRHLAPPTACQMSEASANATGREKSGPRRMVEFGLPTKSLYTMGTALTIVVGAFLMFAWVLRRSGRSQIGRGILPGDAVSVLGRVSLSAKQVAQLLRVGNKLVLVALTPGGAETLTEVTDPAEVDRLMGLCQQTDRHSTTKAFEQVFQSLSREPVTSGFLGAEALPASISPAVAAYRSHRGETSRA
jgi:flagellar biogenesis protein FliO